MTQEKQELQGNWHKRSYTDMCISIRIVEIQKELEQADIEEEIEWQTELDEVYESEDARCTQDFQDLWDLEARVIGTKDKNKR